MVDMSLLRVLWMKSINQIFKFACQSQVESGESEYGLIGLYPLRQVLRKFNAWLQCRHACLTSSSPTEHQVNINTFVEHHRGQTFAGD